MEEITYRESLELPDRLYIDVRSPGEFLLDSIPGSINLPIFDDRERSEIGTIYRITGKDEAIIKGTEIVGHKLSEIVSRIMQYRDRNIIILCFRGGMRSTTVASLAGNLGIRVWKLKNGYRGYRSHVTESLASADGTPEFIILQGLTGTGKTEIIRKIQNSIDLEGMAGHRSSLFGSMGLVPNTQKKFESLLAHRISELQGAPWAVIEGESKKLGNLHIPAPFFEKMCRSGVILVRASMERRVSIIVDEYTRDLDRDQVLGIVRSLKSKLGSALVETLLSLFHDNNLREFTRILLEHYYDPLYRHKLDTMEFISVVDNENTDESVAKIEAFLEERYRA